MPRFHAILFVLFLSLAMSPQTGAAEPDKFISVEGVGKVTAPPDMAVITAGVETRAATAREAVSANNAVMPALFKALEEMGVAKADIQTRNFSVTPEYGRRRPGGKSRTVEGYRASNRVAVKVRDLAAIGALLDRLVTAGANQVQGVRFQVAKPGSVLNRARKIAVADARNRAALYADAAGVRLGKVLRIEERSTGLPRPRLVQAGALRASASAAVSVARGEQEFRATIHVTFAIE